MMSRNLRNVLKPYELNTLLKILNKVNRKVEGCLFPPKPRKLLAEKLLTSPIAHLP